MGGLGFSEILVLLAIALVVIGPDKFPDFIKVVMKTFRDLRGYVDEVKRDISTELKPIEKEVRSLSHYDPETYIDALSRGEVDSKGNVVKSTQKKSTRTGSSAGKSVPSTPEPPKPEPYSSAEATPPDDSSSTETPTSDKTSGDAAPAADSDTNPESDKKTPPPADPNPKGDEYYED